MDSKKSDIDTWKTGLRDEGDGRLVPIKDGSEKIKREATPDSFLDELTLEESLDWFSPEERMTDIIACHCAQCDYKEPDLSDSANLTISEYIQASSLVDSDSEKAFELLRRAISVAASRSQFDELIDALSKFRNLIIHLDSEFDKLENKLFVKSPTSSMYPFFPDIAAKGMQLSHLREIYALKAAFVQIAARDLFKCMPKDKRQDIANVMNLLEEDISEPSSDFDSDLDYEDYEDESLESFTKNSYALTELEPSYTLLLKNLLKETKDPLELLSALESIQDVINEITSRNEWLKGHYETETKAVILKREMVLDRLKDVLNEAHNQS